MTLRLPLGHAVPSREAREGGGSAGREHHSASGWASAIAARCTLLCFTSSKTTSNQLPLAPLQTRAVRVPAGAVCDALLLPRANRRALQACSGKLVSCECDNAGMATAVEDSAHPLRYALQPFDDSPIIKRCATTVL